MKAIVGGFLIRQEDSGKIRVFQANGNGEPEEELANVKAALRDISEDISFTYSPEWTTRQFGRLLINYINNLSTIIDPNSTSLPAGYTPSEAEMVKYHKIWDTWEDYVANEKALDEIFVSDPAFRLNNDMSKVMVKCAALNDFYSTNIFNIYPVAKNIVGIKNIDDRLLKGDLSLVDEIAEADGRRNYSFATKYCSHHQPDKYPIYDRYVARILRDLSKRYPAIPHYTWDDLQDYKKFVNAIDSFMNLFGLANKTYKDIDRYLWVLGKELYGQKKK